MVTGDQSASSERRNVDFPWDQFDPVDYLAHNYESVRDDDRQILAFVRDFFVRVSSSLPDRSTLRGIDVGTGANLYPALAMLPFCDEVTLYEYAQSNVDWLRRQHAARWPSWETAWRDFWLLLCEEPEYASIDRPDMNVELSRRTRVVRGSVFDLDSSPDEWYDLGTMFFGPESLSPQESEFRSALDHLLDALRPDAPFAVAFMEHSTGYQVGNTYFPATDIDLNDVSEGLAGRAWDLNTERFGTGDAPLREGYTGMIIACGRIKGAHRASNPH